MMEVLRTFDDDGLLSMSVREPESDYNIESDDELLKALGVGGEDDITEVKHVRTTAQRNAERSSPEEVAQRKRCEDFTAFRPEFEAVQADIESGRQTTEPFRTSRRTQISKGDWFIVDGMKTLVADAAEWFTPEHGERDRRLRVIYDNGTESDLLMRSLRRALNKDEASRRIVPPQPEVENEDEDFGPLFSDELEDGDAASGTIYVARSLSDDPFIAEHRDLLHKIGVTGVIQRSGSLARKKDPTFLLAEAELVATYKLANVNRKALEATLHRFLAAARLDVGLADRFGDEVKPREWFLVPLDIVDATVQRIVDGSISRYQFDSDSIEIVKAST